MNIGRIAFAVMLLSVIVVPPAFGQAPFGREDVLGIARAAIDHVQDRLPPDGLGLNLEYEAGREVSGNIVWFRPYPMPGPSLIPLIADMIGARPTSTGFIRSEAFRWCGLDESADSGCFNAVITLTQPERVNDNHAKVLIFWRQDLGAHDFRTELLLINEDGRWAVERVLRDEERWYGGSATSNAAEAGESAICHFGARLGARAVN